MDADRAVNAGGCAATLALVLLAALGMSGPAGASEGVARLVLVVGNNRPAVSNQAPLHYADDDALRYHERFEGLAEERILLTRLDDESRPYAALYPEIQPPTRSAIARAAGRLRAAAARLRGQGRFVEILFVFAGHGGLEGGRPYLALEDARVHPEDLESLFLAGDPADVVHVIIDACHAAGFVEQRGPMRGAREALGGDVLPFGRLVERHPRVGFVVAAAASGAAFEWSRYGGGVASHLIRSALSGAADMAPPDGRVTYDELNAFLRTATAGILPSEFRQQIRVVAPRALPSASIVDLDAREGATELLVDRPGRFFVRDADGHRIVDLHHGRGTARLLLAARSPRFQLVEIRERGVGCAGPVRGRGESCAREELAHELVAGGRRRASELAATPSTVATRGVVEDTVFEELLARPYDAGALAIRAVATDDGGTDDQILARPSLGFGYRGTVGTMMKELGPVHGLELRLELPLRGRFLLAPVGGIGRGTAEPVGASTYPVYQMEFGGEAAWLLLRGPVIATAGLEARLQVLDQIPPHQTDQISTLGATGLIARARVSLNPWLSLGVGLAGGARLGNVEGEVRVRPYAALSFAVSGEL